jgi:peptidoglycan hydrolase CwlO-like protein
MKGSAWITVLIAVFCFALVGCQIDEEAVQDQEVARESIDNLDKSIKMLKTHKAELEKTVENLDKQIRVLEATHAYLVQKMVKPKGFWEQYKLMGWQLNIVLLFALVLLLAFRLRNKQS